MTARHLRELAILNTLEGGRTPTRRWYETFTPEAVAALIWEIDKRRLRAGEITSYMSTGDLGEALRELLGPDAVIEPASAGEGAVAPCE